MMRSLACLSLLATAVAAQVPASFTPFGVGCAMNGQTLAIGNQGLPRLGQSFQVTYTGPNFTTSPGQQTAWPQLCLGFAQVTTPIPTGLLTQQPAGCTGYLLPLATVPTGLAPGGLAYDSFVTLALPNSSSLLGVQFLAQWLTLWQQCGFTGCRPAAVLTSDAAIAQIGT